jgi:hypothetical protein
VIEEYAERVTQRASDEAEREFVRQQVVDLFLTHGNAVEREAAGRLV